MNHWFSARGARRGLKLSGLALALWLSWAVGFTQGSAPVSRNAADAAHPSASSPCCEPVHRT